MYLFVTSQTQTRQLLARLTSMGVKQACVYRLYAQLYECDVGDDDLVKYAMLLQKAISVAQRNKVWDNTHTHTHIHNNI